MGEAAEKVRWRGRELVRIGRELARAGLDATALLVGFFGVGGEPRPGIWGEGGRAEGRGRRGGVFGARCGCERVREEGMKQGRSRNEVMGCKETLGPSRRRQNSENFETRPAPIR